jgi:hypothetical protein
LLRKFAEIFELGSLSGIGNPPEPKENPSSSSMDH